jgi:DNA-directed RNA polymerase III subunit RPC1
VKKCGLLKVLHEKHRPPSSRQPPSSESVALRGALLEAAGQNRELLPHIGKAQENLNPLRVLSLFQSIPDEDIPLVGMSSENGRPESLILTRILVPPLCVRPSIVSDTQAGTTEDDVTMKLTEIIFLNDVIQKHRTQGAKIQMIMVR